MDTVDVKPNTSMTLSVNCKDIPFVGIAQNKQYNSTMHCLQETHFMCKDRYVRSNWDRKRNFTLCQFPKTSITKYHSLDSLITQFYFFTLSRLDV